MTQDGFDFTKKGRTRELAELLRDLGMDRAAEHADAELPKWSEIAYAYVGKHAERASAPFTGEDVREAAENAGLPPPPDKRAWGGVMMRASRNKVIVATGEFRQARDPKVHCNNIRVWRAP